MDNLILVNIGYHFLAGESLIASYFLQYCDERVHAEIESYCDMFDLLRQNALMQIFHMHFNRISLIKQTQQFGV